MLHLVETGRTYGPETVAVMTTAFERVCEAIYPRINDDEVRRKVALVILRHVDRGELDPKRLAGAALRELASCDDAAIGDRQSASG